MYLSVSEEFTASHPSCATRITYQSCRCYIYLFIYIHISIYLSWRSSLHHIQATQPALAARAAGNISIYLSIYIYIHLSILEEFTASPLRCATRTSCRNCRHYIDFVIYIYMSIYLSIYLGPLHYLP